MLAKLIRLFIMFILEKIGLVSSREVEDQKDRKEERFWEDGSFWKDMFGRRDNSQTVEGTWRDVREDTDSRKEKSKPVDGDWREFRDDAGSRKGKSKTVDGDWREFRDDAGSRKGKSKTVDGDWREFRDDADRKSADGSSASFSSESTASDSSESGTDDSGSIQDTIRKLSVATEGIRHPKIREQAFHVLIIAKDIIYEHDAGHNKCPSYNQFENYYVPTLTSVINNYYSIESRGMATAKMKKDVLSYLESCGDAFNKIYNSMFNDDIMSMEVQMEAMDIIMKRDGLL